MDLHNVIMGASPMWNSKHRVPKVHRQPKGMWCIPGLPFFPKADQEAVHNSSLQTKKCIPSCDDMGRGWGEVRALQEDYEYSRNSFTEHLLFYQSSVN